MGEYVAEQNYLHVLPRIGQSVFAGAEKHQDGVQKNKAEDAEQNAYYGVERDFVGQNFVGYRIVFLPEQDGEHGRRAHTHQRSQRR